MTAGALGDRKWLLLPLGAISFALVVLALGVMFAQGTGCESGVSRRVGDSCAWIGVGGVAAIGSVALGLLVAVGAFLRQARVPWRLIAALLMLSALVSMLMVVVGDST